MGRNYSHSFGYGVMDASGMVKMAQKWKNVGTQVTSAVKAAIGPVSIPAMSSRTAKMEVTDHGDVNFLEHVQAHVTIDSSRRGDLAIFLTSPHGTKSQLLARRPHDSSRAGFHDWPFLTVFSWGENPAGTWELEVQNDGRYEVTLRAWSMTFHGTKDDPDQSQLPSPATYPPSPSPSPTPAPVALVEPSPKAVELPKAPESIPYHAPVSPTASIDYCTKLARPGWCQECEVGYRILAGRCVKKCPEEGYYEGVSNNTATCLSCCYSCQTCSGPSDSECLSCFGDADLDESSGDGKYCHNKNLIFKIFSSWRWHYVLSIGFFVNFIIVVLLVFYICRWRASKAGKSKSSLLERVKSSTRNYSPVANKGLSVKSGSTLPFHDYEESSDETDDFMKPYSDDPSATTFLKPYTDDE